MPRLAPPAHAQALTTSLERKGVLAKLKAELRAHVFEAVRSKDASADDDANGRRQKHRALPKAKLLSALVLEYLEWSGLSSSRSVFAAESGEEKNYEGRDVLAAKLGTRGTSSERPLLLAVLESHFGVEDPLDELPAPGGAATTGPGGGGVHGGGARAPSKVGKLAPLAPSVNLGATMGKRGAAVTLPPASPSPSPSPSASGNVLVSDDESIEIGEDLDYSDLGRDTGNLSLDGGGGESPYGSAYGGLGRDTGVSMDAGAGGASMSMGGGNGSVAFHDGLSDRSGSIDGADDGSVDLVESAVPRSPTLGGGGVSPRGGGGRGRR
jgi:hypothetical protein